MGRGEERRLRFSVMTIRRRNSSVSKSSGVMLMRLLPMKRSTKPITCASRCSRLPFHVGFIWS